MTYWYEVGVHPTPTMDDVPVLVRYRDGTMMAYSEWPLLSVGDRWCHVTLPSETAPPPEDEGVEVEGVRYRITDAWVQVFYEGRWVEHEMAEDIAGAAKVAIALGLVDPTVPAEPIDGAERTAPREVPLRLSPLGFTEVARGTISEPPPSWPPMRPMSDLPPEPPIGSVVEDDDGRRWWRHRDGSWRSTRTDLPDWIVPWSMLARAHPNLAVLREGPAS